MNHKSMSGKIALVTGGAQGIGEAAARALADRGLKGVVLADRQATKGENVRASLAAAGVEAVFVHADLSDFDSLADIVATADATFGRIDVLVNAAGKTDRGSIWDTDRQLFDELFSTNVRAPFFLMQHALKVMRREAIQGSIINIISMAAHGGKSFASPYASTKGALQTLTKNVAYSVMRHRIRVNGINPGWVDTPGEDRIMKTYHGAVDGWAEKEARQRPFGRLISPAELAEVVAFLAGPESGLMTGTIIDYEQEVTGTSDSRSVPPDHDELSW